MAVTYTPASSWVTNGVPVSDFAAKEVTVTVGVGDLLVAVGMSTDHNTNSTTRGALTMAGSTTAWTDVGPTTTINSDCDVIGSWAEALGSGSVTVSVALRSQTVHMGAAVWVIPAAEWDGSNPTITTMVGDADGQMSVTLTATSKVFYAGADWSAQSAGTSETPTGATEHDSVVDAGQYSIVTRSWQGQAVGTRNYGPTGISGADYAGVIIVVAEPIASLLPTVGAVTTAIQTAGSNIVVNVPSHAEGDRLVVAIRSQQNNSTTDLGNAGWTRIGPAFLPSSNAGRIIGFWTRVATASEPGSYTFSGQTAATRIVASMFVLPKVAGVTPAYDAGTASYTGTATGLISRTSMTTAHTNALVLTMHGNEVVTPNSSTPTSGPSGFTQLALVPSSADTGVTRTTLYVGYKAQAIVGATGDIDVTWASVSGQSAQSVSFWVDESVAPAETLSVEIVNSALTEVQRNYCQRPQANNGWAVGYGGVGAGTATTVADARFKSGAARRVEWTTAGTGSGWIATETAHPVVAGETWTYSIRAETNFAGTVFPQPNLSVTTVTFGTIDHGDGTKTYWRTYTILASGNSGLILGWFTNAPVGTIVLAGDGMITKTSNRVNFFMPAITADVEYTAKIAPAVNEPNLVSSWVATQNVSASVLSAHLNTSPVDVWVYDGTDEVPVSQVMALEKRSFTVAEMDAMITNDELVYWAHRGGSANWPEMTMRAYTNAVWHGALILEISVHRSSDGVWILSHDATLTRVTATTHTISSTPSSTLLGIPVDTPTTGGVIGRLEDILNAYPDHVLLVDNKPGSYFSDFLDLLETVPNATEHIIVKLDGQYGSVANFQAAQARGFKTCGYWYPNNYAANLPSRAAYCDYIGMQYDATSGEWAEVLSYGKPVWGHVCQNQAQADLCIAGGASIIQCANVIDIIPQRNVI